MRFFLIITLLTTSLLTSAQKFNHQQILVEKADKLLENDKPKAANKIYKSLLQDFSKRNFPDSTKGYILSQYAMSFRSQSDWQNALKYSHKAVNLFEKTYGKQSDKTVDEWYNLGYIHSALEDFDSLSFYWLKCIDTYKVIGGKYHDIALTYNNLGSNFRGQHRYFQAYQYFKKAVGNWEKVAYEQPIYLAIGYDNLGAILETQEGIYYLQKALNIKLENGTNPFRSYIEIGSKYQNLEQFNQALFYYKKGLNYLKEAIQNPPKKDFAYQYDLASTYSLIASIYESKTDYETAISYLNKAIQITIIEKYPIKKTQFLIKKGNILSKQGQQEAALEILEAILKNSDNSPLFGYVTNILAGVYAEQEKFEKALTINQLSINFNQNRSTNRQSENFLKRFQYDDFPLTSNAAISISNHAKYLYQYSDLHSDNPQKQEQILITALHNIQQAILLFKAIQNTTTYYLYAKRKFNQAIDRQQEILFALAKLTNQNQYLEQAFSASEVSKFNRILVNFNHLKLQTVGNIPPKIFQQEQNFRIRISQLKDAIFYAEQANDNVENATIRRQYDNLFQLNKKYNNLLKFYEKKYPNYYKIRHQVKPVKIAELQKQLDNPSILISYFIGENHIFIYEITKEKFTTKRVQKPVDFEKEIQYYRQSLQDFSSDISLIQQKGQSFYDLLLKNTLKNYSTKTNILILPDKELSTIPYETFVKNEQYLIENYNIHYAYSATLWQQQKTLKRRKSTQKWVGFAPTYDNYDIEKNDTLTDVLLASYIRNSQLKLSGTIEEVQQINKLLEGKTYLNQVATEAKFKENANDFQVLHLAMHALLEDENPMYSKLLFTQKDTKENGFLTISELYNLQLNADLAVLSACNTGVGKLQPGEGVLSLSQAFMAAGCPSTLTTLWQIPDAETAGLMLDFYKHLKRGKSKNEALRLAKINYLKMTSNPRAKHPYFWAAFLLSGDAQKIDLERKWSVYWWIFGGLICLVSSYLLFRFIRK